MQFSCIAHVHGISTVRYLVVVVDIVIIIVVVVIIIIVVNVSYHIAHCSGCHHYEGEESCDREHTLLQLSLLLSKLSFLIIVVSCFSMQTGAGVTTL